jgi:hypothetical protein
MKFWLEAQLEYCDSHKKCAKCGKVLSVPDHLFCEFALEQGNMPNTDEYHPQPTGKFFCPNCATILV